MHESWQNEAGNPRGTMVCRCEEIMDVEIAAALASGARTVDDVKRRTRAGMGVCQGVFCVPVITALVAQATNADLAHVAPMTSRPPVRPIGLAALAGLGDEPPRRPTARVSDSEG